LSLKLIEDLKKGKTMGRTDSARTLKELVLDEPIRYAPGDAIEAWLNRLLCLNAAQVPQMHLKTLPMPSECGLFLVNRDALFSHHEASEQFLFKIMSLFVSSHSVISRQGLHFPSLTHHRRRRVVPAKTRTQRQHR